MESYEKRAMKEEENRIQYQKSIHQAERLEEEAEKVQKISEEMTERLQHLSSVWQTDNSVFFFNKVHILRGLVNESAVSLKLAAEKIIEISRSVREGEREPENTVQESNDS